MNNELMYDHQKLKELVEKSKGRKRGLDEYEIVLIFRAKHGSEGECIEANKTVYLAKNDNFLVIALAICSFKTECKVISVIVNKNIKISCSFVP